jgi:FeS assembly SUF system protein
MGIFNLDSVPPPKPKTAEEPAKPETPAPVPPAASGFDMSAFTAPPPPKTEPAPPVEADPLKTLELKPKIVEQLSTVYDPEIPVNIYELGLICDVAVGKDGLAVIKMTLTAPGCPAAITLPAEVRAKVKAISGVSDVRVDLVWEPPWSKDRMSEAAKLHLGIFE